MDWLVYSFDDVSSVAEEGSSPPSGPASAPSGTPPGFVAVSPTWWKSECNVREGIARPVGWLTEDLTIHHHFPGIHGEVRIVETPIKLLRSLRFIGGIMIRGDIFMSQGIGRVDALAWIKDEHLLEEVQSYSNDRSGISETL